MFKVFLLQSLAWFYDRLSELDKSNQLSELTNQN